ncbi:MAG: arginine--tRNA ligase [Acidobacteria bacterium]|nr:arginine--tRNA ligase [Acidobacteriota bacterium]
MYLTIEKRIQHALAEHIRRRYELDVPVPASRPPKIEMGEVASPVCFELAKRLKRAPRQLAQEIVAEIAPIEGVARWEVAGGGYLNAFLDRGAFFDAVARSMFSGAGAAQKSAAPGAPKTIVEHTNINPNKAAHIGHLRNAALGDTFVRLLRQAGEIVEVQNYIDNTGVQVADVVIGLLHLEKKSPDDVRQLAAEPRFDFYCWDLYARVTQFYEEDKARESLRAETLKAIEEGRGAAAKIGEIVSDAIVRCHLRTMERLGVRYDVLPRESDILHLKFWDIAFQQLKDRGAIQLASAGKNAGCWVMPLSEDRDATAEDDTKIIVRSNGTVTYVGKDIAYQMWKFGLLGKDFHYRKFQQYPDGSIVWASCSDGGEVGAPPFGRAARVYNVIDSRQSYLQKVVMAGLRALGYNEQADRSVHFSYEMVALTPRCAVEMGYEIPLGDARKPYVEVSGRKGLGVKADDLLDRLESNARAEVDKRHPDAPEPDRAQIAHAIAIGALRYFLLKYTRNTIIAFDFKDALSFEGETGPYCQYAVVRARNIFRKYAEATREKHFPGPPRTLGPNDPAIGVSSASAGPEDMKRFLGSPEGNDLWELLLLAGSLDWHADAALNAQEPAFVAKFAFQLAQAFNNFYHKHHILSEEDPARKTLLLNLTTLIMAQLVRALDLLGIEAPERM